MPLPFHWSVNKTRRFLLLNVIQGIDIGVLELNESNIIKTLLDGRKLFDILINTNILNPTIDIILQAKRFNQKL